jgi:hypothetical protein
MRNYAKIQRSTFPRENKPDIERKIQTPHEIYTNGSKKEDEVRYAVV